jgi:hypothetical protein
LIGKGAAPYKKKDWQYKYISVSNAAWRMGWCTQLVHGIFYRMHHQPDMILKKVCQEAYLDACGPYHNWAIRTIATAAMNALTTKEKFLKAIEAENPDDVQFISEKTGILMDNVLGIFKDR